VKRIAAATVLVLVLGACGTEGRARPARPSRAARAAPPALQLTIDVPAPVLVTCGEAAQETRIRVVCPPLVPVGGVTDHSPQVTTPDVYTMSFNNGQVPGHIHWEVGAGTLAGVATAEFDERDWDAPAPKQPPVLIGGQRCAPYLIRIYRFPENDGQLEGHDVALATAGAVTYFASIHGYTHDAADVAMLLAILRSARGDHVTRVGPALDGCRAVIAK
jgi:hypothetical protein